MTWPIPTSQTEPTTPAERVNNDGLQKSVGGGALVIDDGGGTYNYTQDLDENTGRDAFQFPTFLGTDGQESLLDVLRDMLGRLPFDALKILETFLSGGISFIGDVADAVTKIMDSLSFDNIALRMDSFLEMLVGFVEATPTDLDNFLLSLVGIDSVSAGSLTKESPELLKNPFFLTPVSLANGSTQGWHLDDADKHSATGHAAVNTTDIVQDYTIISSLVKVEAEKILELRAHVKWDTISSASGADAITLCLLPDGSGLESDAIVIDSIPLSVCQRW